MVTGTMYIPDLLDHQTQSFRTCNSIQEALTMVPREAGLRCRERGRLICCSSTKRILSDDGFHCVSMWDLWNWDLGSYRNNKIFRAPNDGWPSTPLRWWGSRNWEMHFDAEVDISVPRRQGSRTTGERNGAAMCRGEHWNKNNTLLYFLVEKSKCSGSNMEKVLLLHCQGKSVAAVRG